MRLNRGSRMKNLHGNEIVLILVLICLSAIVIVAMLTGNLDNLLH